MQNENTSFPAQVASITDTDGTIHPQWFRFKNSDGELITIRNLRIKRESPDSNLIGKNFLCVSAVYGQEQEFFCVTIIADIHGQSNIGLQNRKDSISLVGKQGYDTGLLCL